MSILIHNKEYVTVAERLKEARAHIMSITTEVLPNTNGTVVVKATVLTDKGTFTGISGANPSKTIEKQSPYEVAETSAVGRALGFAGFGVVDNIATADEMKKAEPDPTDEWPDQPKEVQEANSHYCTIHNKPMKERTGKNGVWYDHRWQENGEWQQCSGTPKGANV